MAYIVGNLDCPYGRIIQAITKDNEYMLSGPAGDWNIIADALNLSPEDQKRHQHDLKLDLTRLRSVLKSILTNWRLQESERATLHRLIHILEENGMTDISNNLREEFELNSQKKIEEQETFLHQSFAVSKICFHNITCQLQDIFDHQQLQICEDLFRRHLTKAKFYELFIINKCAFKLVNSILPSPPIFYIERKFSSRYIFNMNMFKVNELSPDVFVFSGLQRCELTALVNPEMTTNPLGTISSHLYITNPEIYPLEEGPTIVFLEIGFEDHWENIRLTKNPAHLLNYEPDTKQIILKSTYGNSDIFQKYVSLDRKQCITVDDIINEKTDFGFSNGIIFCDIFGSGKTDILKYLATKVLDHDPKQIIAFISVETFKDFLDTSKSTSLRNFPFYFTKILEHIAVSDESLDILSDLIEVKLLKMHLFIDDIDMQGKELTLKAIEMLRFIKNYKNIRVYVTCRPQTRHLLEEALGNMAYNIMPLSKSGQIDLLAQSWLDTIQPNAFKKSKNVLRNELKILADQYLQHLVSTLSIKDDNIIGIPNFCKMFGQMYQKVACRSANTPKGSIDYSPICSPSNIFSKYKTFIETCLNSSVTFTSLKCQQKSFLGELHSDVAYLPQRKDQVQQTFELKKDKVKQWYILHALHKLFPHIFNIITYQTSENKNLILSACLLQYFQIRRELSNDFLDTTVPEYFIAEYLADCFSVNSKIESKPFWFRLSHLFSRNTFVRNESDKVIAILRELASDNENFNKSHSTKLYFLNAFITNSKPENKQHVFVKFFCEEISPESYFMLLGYCLRYNLVHIFCFAASTLKNADAQRTAVLTQRNVNKLLATASKYADIDLFKECISLVEKFSRPNVFSLCCTRNDFRGPKFPTPLEFAVEMGTYEVVEYLYLNCELQNRNLLHCCVRNTANVSPEMLSKKVNILGLLLTKCSISELPQPEWNQLNMHAKLYEIVQKKCHR